MTGEQIQGIIIASGFGLFLASMGVAFVIMLWRG